MGKPATTYFCGNGHVLEHNPHHCLGNYDYDGPKQPCKYCQSKEVFCATEWLDEDYEQFVPEKPIRFDDVLFVKSQPKKNISIPVYDISRLKSFKTKSKKRKKKTRKF